MDRTRSPPFSELMVSYFATDLFFFFFYQSCCRYQLSSKSKMTSSQNIHPVFKLQPHRSTYRPGNRFKCCLAASTCRIGSSFENTGKSHPVDPKSLVPLQTNTDQLSLTRPADEKQLDETAAEGENSSDRCVFIDDISCTLIGAVHANSVIRDPPRCSLAIRDE